MSDMDLEPTNMGLKILRAVQLKLPTSRKWVITRLEMDIKFSLLHNITSEFILQSIANIVFTTEK